MKTVEGWMDSIEFEHELEALGRAVYSTRDRCVENNPCIEEGDCCEVRRVYVVDADEYDKTIKELKDAISRERNQGSVALKNLTQIICLLYGVDSIGRGKIK